LVSKEFDSIATDQVQTQMSELFGDWMNKRTKEREAKHKQHMEMMERNIKSMVQGAAMIRQQMQK